MPSNKLQVMANRQNVQTQKKQKFLLSRIKDQQDLKNQEFNIGNMLAEAGTAWVASGFNPIAAVAAGVTAKKGGNDILGSVGRGGAKGLTIQALQSKGGGQGADLIQTTGNLGAGAVESPEIALQTAKAFMPGKEAEAVAGIQTAQTKKETLDLAKKEMKLKEDKEKRASRDVDKEVQDKMDIKELVDRALVDTKKTVTNTVFSILGMPPDDLKNLSKYKVQEQIKTKSATQLQSARDFLDSLYMAQEGSDVTQIDALKQALMDQKATKKDVKNWEDELNTFIYQLRFMFDL